MSRKTPRLSEVIQELNPDFQAKITTIELNKDNAIKLDIEKNNERYDWVPAIANTLDN